MIKLKRKNLDRREWYTDAQRKFSCMYHRDGSFAGAMGLLTFTGLEKPETVRSVRGEVCIADNGYQWLELAPENAHWALTAMFRGDDLFEQYIDITLENEVSEDGNAVFTDLLLDVVVLSDGEPLVVDGEELEEALSAGLVTREQYNLAKETAGKIAEFYRSHSGLIRGKLFEYRALFRKP